MNLDHLVTDVKHLLKTKTKEQIYQELLAKGVSLNNIEEAFNKVQNSPADPKKHIKTENSNQSLYIIGIFGAVLLGIGIFSIIAANWSNISDLAKVLIIIFVTMLLHGFGIVADYTFKLKNLANSLYLAGSLAFGGGLFLVTQIFILPVIWSDFYIIWFIGVAILGLVLKSYLHEYLGIFIVLLISTFSFGNYLFYYSYNPTLQNNPYSTIILSFCAAILAIYWAKSLRARDTDQDLNNIF